MGVSSHVSLPAKQAAAVLPVVFDFTSQLAVAETISSATVTATVYSGTDASPAILSGSPSVSGPRVSQTLTGGVVGVTYKLTCAATTSLSKVLVLAGFTTIIPAVT